MGEAVFPPFSPSLPAGEGTIFSSWVRRMQIPDRFAHGEERDNPHLLSEFLLFVQENGKRGCFFLFA